MRLRWVAHGTARRVSQVLDGVRISRQYSCSGVRYVGHLGPLCVVVVKVGEPGQWQVEEVFGAQGALFGPSAFSDLRTALEKAEEMAGRAFAAAQAYLQLEAS